MKEMDLMYAMTDLDEEFLQVRDSKVRKNRLRKFAAVAAAAALMTVTVCSAVMGTKFQFGQDPDGYYTIDYRYPMEPVTVLPEVYEDMSKALVDGLLDYQQGIERGDYEVPDTRDLGYSKALDQEILCSLGDKFDTLDQVEDYLGVSLRVSTELREMLNTSLHISSSRFEPGLFKVYGPSYEVALEEYSNTGTVTPQGIGICAYLYDGEENNWYAGLRVYIPLTEEFATQFQPDTWYSMEGRGQYVTREYSNGSQSFVIAKVEYTEEYGDTCLALYDDGGIGYELYCCAWPTDLEKSKIGEDVLTHILGTWSFDGEVCKDSEEIILPLIENIK